MDLLLSVRSWVGRHQKISYVLGQVLLLILVTMFVSVTFSLHYNGIPLIFGYGSLLVAPLVLTRHGFQVDLKWAGWRIWRTRLSIDSPPLFTCYVLLAGIWAVGHLVGGGPVLMMTLYLCLWSLCLFLGEYWMGWTSFAIGMLGALCLQIYGMDKPPYLFGLILNMLFVALTVVPVVMWMAKFGDEEAETVPDSGQFQERKAA